jgi:hypothetical protein
VIFNTREWARIVTDCYGFEDRSVAVGEASLPLFLTSSPLLGRKLVSAVYNTYASPSYRTKAELEALLAEAVQSAKHSAVDYLEIKSFGELDPQVVERLGLLTRSAYKLTTVELAPYAQMSSRWSGRFRRDLRAWSRRLADRGVAIERTRDRRDWLAFYHLLVRRYRDRHRMIAQPFELFELIRERLEHHDSADLWVAHGSRGVVAGAVYGLHAGVASGLFSAADESYAAESIDTLLKHEALRHYAESGMTLCDFGITSPKQIGVLFAKGRFRGCTRDVPFYYYLVRANRLPEIDYADAFLWLRRPFRYLPLPLAERLSSRLVRYLN